MNKEKIKSFVRGSTINKEIAIKEFYKWMIIIKKMKDMFVKVGRSGSE
jgi:hypothetical protein